MPTSPTPSSRPLRILIVGAGFSGALSAVHLLKSASADAPVSVTLAERSGRFGTGLAYATPSTVHFLNVPAGNMSAFDDDPGHFLRWAQERDPLVHTGSFLPRGHYGQYLEHVLARARAAAGDRLTEVAAGVTRLTPLPSGSLRAELDSGAVLEVDRVILATGHAAPPLPPAGFAGLASHPAYVHNVWAPGVLDRIRPDEPVFIVGCGLTMVDVVMSLHARDHEGRILALSRHGLLPRPHRSPSRPPAHRDPPAALKSWDGSARELVRILRTSVRESAGRGTDWRDVVSSIRSSTPALWQRMDLKQRQRFLDRLRSFWEVVRHRAAPESAAVINDLVAARRLQVRAGRLVDIRPSSGPAANLLDVTFRPKRSDLPQTHHFARVINCLGPESDVTKSADPLMRQLLAEGMVTPDPLGLGINVTDAGHPIGKDGRAIAGVLVVGPLRRGHAWENLAVPELRKQAAQVAKATIASAVSVPA